MSLFPKIDLDIVHTVNEFLTTLRSIDARAVPTVSLFPKINLDIVHTVNEFLTTLRSIDAKLDTLIEAQEEANRNSIMDRLGRTTRERQASDQARFKGMIEVPCPDDAMIGYVSVPVERMHDHTEHCTAATCCIQAVVSCSVDPTDADLDELRRKLEGQ